MNKKNYRIQRYMTSAPITINCELDLLHAKKFMSDHQVRHLPVLEHGHVVGVISSRDIDYLEKFHDIDLKKEKVASAMSSDPYIVEVETPLDEVCKVMAKNKYGCVLIQENKKIVGIFTWVDALDAIDNLIHAQQRVEERVV